jgi:glycosyltransferase involved in cell wall biosynthesis
MTGLADCVLVMLEAIPFHGLMQRHQHLARELSRHLPVVYAENTPSFLRRFFDRNLLDPSLKAHRLGLQPVGDNLSLYKSPPAYPRSLGWWKSASVTEQRVAKALRPLLPKGKPVITWFCSPICIGAIGLYDQVASVLDYFDAFGEFPGEERFKSDIKQATRELAGKVDLVLATNDELRASLSGHNENTFVVQNGCDLEHYIGGGREPSAQSRIIDIERLPRPIIGYMGDIAPWFDIEHVELAAARHPEWSFVLLGTWKRDSRLHAKYPNIHAPGHVPYEELPYYVRHFDVGIIPFEMTELTRVVNPLKLYEYFALGLPVVATALPEIVRHGDLVYIAESPEDFVKLAEAAVREPKDSPMRARRVDVARSNSWCARGEEIVVLLKKILEDKG